MKFDVPSASLDSRNPQQKPFCSVFQGIFSPLLLIPCASTNSATMLLHCLNPILCRYGVFEHSSEDYILVSYYLCHCAVSCYSHSQYGRALEASHNPVVSAMTLCYPAQRQESVYRRAMVAAKLLRQPA